MLRYLAALSLLTSTVGCAPPREEGARASSGRAIKVATWNLEHLAERDGAGCRPRTEEDYATLRRHAVALNADVIAFQEVENLAAAQRVFDPALFEIAISKRPVSGRGGGCYGRPGQTIRHQAVGFAIRKGLAWSRNPDLADLALGNADLRWGVDITIRGRVPLRLLGVHLKSGCNSGRAATDADCPVLFGQAPVLERWVDDRASAGEAFMVLGDWNRRITARSDAFFADINDGDPKGAELQIAAADRAATCKARYREFIDHIVMGSKAAAAFVPGSFEEYTYGVAEAEHPSDHCPVSVTLAR